MADSSIVLTAADREAIVGQAAPLLRYLRSSSRSRSRYELAESFEVSVIPGLPATSSIMTLSSLVRPTALVHHQIINARRSHFLYGRSRRDAGGSALRLLSLVESSISKTIDELVTRLDAESPSDDAIARILSAPQYHLVCLWLDSPTAERVHVIHHQRGSLFRRLGDHTSAEFLERLLRERPIGSPRES